ncbi:MAG: hypothetical protein Q7U74_00880 [Saprospiraceae bacterium]|nr:hypothetical protein [Saprospiraceae bacterium]
MQLPFFAEQTPSGYVRFFPDVPTEIYLALGGSQALEKVGAHNVLCSHNALQIDLCAANGVTMVHVTLNSLKAYDIYFYNAKGACVSYAYHVLQNEIVGVFRSGTGLVNFKRKYVQLDQAVCYDEEAVAA